jgi:hypothetical protein
VHSSGKVKRGRQGLGIGDSGLVKCGVRNVGTEENSKREKWGQKNGYQVLYFAVFQKLLLNPVQYFFLLISSIRVTVLPV